LLGLIDIVIAIGQTVSITLGAALVAGAIILFGVASMNTLVQAKVPDALRVGYLGVSTTSALASLGGS
jgi:hypothetical protein